VEYVFEGDAFRITNDNSLACLDRFSDPLVRTHKLTIEKSVHIR